MIIFKAIQIKILNFRSYPFNRISLLFAVVYFWAENHQNEHLI